MVPSPSEPIHILIRLVEGQLAPSAAANIPEEAWTSLVRRLHAEGMAPLVYRAVQRAGLLSAIPDEAARALSALYYHTAAFNALLGREFMRIVLAAARLPGVPPPVALKGIMLIPQVYGNPALRPLQDIDLLVSPDHLELMASLLRDLGYSQIPFLDDHLSDETEHHYIFRRQRGHAPPLTVELHWHLVTPQPQVTAWFWKHVRRCELPPTCFGLAPARQQANALLVVRELTPTANLLYLIAHLGVQHAHTAARLIWLYDIHRLVCRFHERVNWPLLVAQAQRFGWEGVLSKVAVQSQRLFGTPWPAEVTTRRPSDLVGLEWWPGVPTRLESVWQRAGTLPWRVRVRYVVRQAIPAKEYMLWRYRPRPSWLWPLWYLYRWALALSDAARALWWRLRGPIP